MGFADAAGVISFARVPAAYRTCAFWASLQETRFRPTATKHLDPIASQVYFNRGVVRWSSGSVMLEAGNAGISRNRCYCSGVVNQWNERPTCAPAKTSYHRLVVRRSSAWRRAPTKKREPSIFRRLSPFPLFLSPRKGREFGGGVENERSRRHCLHDAGERDLSQLFICQVYREGFFAPPSVSPPTVLRSFNGGRI